jgi:hypothetical protein
LFGDDEILRELYLSSLWQCDRFLGVTVGENTKTDAICGKKANTPVLIRKRKKPNPQRGLGVQKNKLLYFVFSEEERG